MTINTLAENPISFAILRPIPTPVVKFIFDSSVHPSTEAVECIWQLSEYV